MDDLQDIRARLAGLEARLTLLEAERDAAATPHAAAAAPAAAAPAAAAVRRPAAPPREAATATPVAAPAPAGEGPVAARWMAGGAATAFLLAAVYLLRVVYESGWLTPEREVVLAVLGGLALVAAGLWVARYDRAYAAWLPASGSVVLYVAAYGAHLYYGLIGRHAAIAAVGATSVLALWLGRRFGRSVFVVFAVLGTYLFPLLLPGGTVPAADIAVYFAAWCLVYSGAALLEGRRLPYVLAMYCALLGFQLAWRHTGVAGDWQYVVLFQLFQFVLFVVVAIAFSVLHRRPMDSADAFAHGVALFCFYAFEYALLHDHAPALAGPLALASALFVLAAYLLARGRLPQESRDAGAVLVAAYASAVTAHVLFFEWTPDGLVPWAALLAPLAVAAATPLFRDTPAALWPVRVVAGFVFVMGLLAALVDGGSPRAVLPDVVLFAYAGALYLGHLALRRQAGAADAGLALLYAAHVCAMLAFARALDEGLAISVAWALLALAMLALALATRDRGLARSSLIIFAASGLKTLLVDLQGSDSLPRVLTLLVVGASLYAGGWLYQRTFNAPAATPAPPPRNP